MMSTIYIIPCEYSPLYYDYVEPWEVSKRLHTKFYKI